MAFSARSHLCRPTDGELKRSLMSEKYIKNEEAHHLSSVYHRIPTKSHSSKHIIRRKAEFELSVPLQPLLRHFLTTLISNPISILFHRDPSRSTSPIKTICVPCGTSSSTAAVKSRKSIWSPAPKPTSLATTLKRRSRADRASIALRMVVRMKEFIASYLLVPI